jgi:hypothetical protein
LWNRGSIGNTGRHKKSVKMSSTAKSSTISRWTSVISLLLLVDVNLVTLKF